MYGGIADGKGAGIGISNIILTIQKTGTESGCVGWDGTADVIGSTACPAGLVPAIAGGDEKTGSSQTQTQSIATTAVTSASNMVVILNVNEPAGCSFTVNNISLTIFSSGGSVLFNSGNLTGVPLSFNASQQGQGNLGFAFVLDSSQAAIAQSFFSDTTNRFGIAATLSGTAGSNETLSIADLSVVTIEAPEPAGVLLTGAGLIGLGLAFRANRAARRKESRPPGSKPQSAQTARSCG